MSRSSNLMLAAAAVVATSAVAADGEHSKYGFGKPASAVEIAGWDIDVRPDGRGLPPGRGTVAEGQQAYDAKCASCHGTFGESNDYLPIAGGVGTLASSQPMRTTGSKLNYATTLFDYIRRAMPFPNPKSLTDGEVYALTAYVLHLNDVLPADAALDRQSLPALVLPNRDGFTTDHGFMRRDGKPDTHNKACMQNCAASVRLSSEIPEHARDSHGNLAEQTRALGPLEGVNVATPMPGHQPGAPPTEAGGELARKVGCLACHGVDAKVVGPAFRDVAARYAGNTDARTALLHKIRNGGSGAWGDVPMPAQAVGDADGHALVEWILSRSR